MISGLTGQEKLAGIKVRAFNPISGLRFGAIGMSSSLLSILDIGYKLDRDKSKDKCKSSLIRVRLPPK